MMQKEVKQEIINTYKRHENDTGSPEVQIAILTYRINHLTEHLKNNIVHYHLVDSMGKTHDSLTLGTGKIDWAAVLPRLNTAATSIYEINLKNQNDCREQLESHKYLLNLYNKLTN